MIKFKVSKILENRLINLYKYIRFFALLLSIITLLAVIYDYGFYYSFNQEKQLHIFYTLVWIYFIFTVTYRLIIDFLFKGKLKKINIKLSAMFLYLSLLPYIVSIFISDSLINTLLSIFESRIFFYSSLVLFSLSSISNNIVRLISKKTNPAAIMALSFLVIILIGTGLLLLPRCTYINLSFIDSLFISTSAVCVTGLTPLDVSSTFTFHGQLVLLLLFQIGGLGVMTFTSFFALFFMGNTGLFSQLALKDMISSNSLISLFSALVHIMGFTFFIEGVGMLFIFADIHGTMNMPLKDELFFSLFHSVSAFCNAGFSTLPNNLGNDLILHNHNFFYITISFLIILGGIGFPLLVNFREIVVYYSKYFWKRVICKDLTFSRVCHIANINSKIVITTTFLLIAGGSLLIGALEWNRSFASLGVYDKIVQSFFNAVSPRTAGFTSIDLTMFSIPTIIVCLFLMWVGGAAQSTAGGIKVNVLAASWYNLKSIIRGENKVNVFGREISDISIRRANATIFISLIVLFISILGISIFQPELSVKSIIYECFSAFGTVGSSLNTTQLLNDTSKVCIIFLMFAGRVGISTLLMSILSKKVCEPYKFPQEQIIIN